MANPEDLKVIAWKRIKNAGVLKYTKGFDYLYRVNAVRNRITSFKAKSIFQLLDNLSISYNFSRSSCQ